jgi:hypothetical protein
MCQIDVRTFTVAAGMLGTLSGTTHKAWAQATAAEYPAMAPLEQYLMPDGPSEIALARTAAPPAISDLAEVLVLSRRGYTVAVPGKNGFVCIVERSWVMDPNNPEFWNPKIRAPNCFDPTAARTYVPLDLMKTRLALAGRSKAQIGNTIASALEAKKLPAFAPGGMCYMMSKEQYLNDDGKSWRPHLMFYFPGDVTKSWGANLPGSPVRAVMDAEARATVLMVLVHGWSDGTVAPQAAQ